MEHRRYTRKEKAEYDKAQTILTPMGAAPNPHAYAVTSVTTTVLPLEKMISCPFCLGLSKFSHFLVSTKKSISSKMGKCPLCGQGVHLRTLKLMSTCTAKQYAEWVWPYSKFGFWKLVQLVPFSTWKDRLKLMGWTQEFWDRYKELKAAADKDDVQEAGPDSSESFMDYVARKQGSEGSREEEEKWEAYKTDRDASLAQEAQKP